MRTLAKTLLLSAAALALSAGPAAAREVGTTGPGHDPAGNNGTIKVDRMPFDDAPNNEPHVGCTFEIDFYGFDAGVGDATVTFESQAPTAGAVIHGTAPARVPIGEDPAGGGTDLDASQQYTLSFTGTPHPQQGYHVKLTIDAPGSQGSDVKHKVFWVEPCGATTPPPPPPGVGGSNGGSNGSGEDHHGATGGTTPTSLPPAPATVESAAEAAAPTVVASASQSRVAEVLGEQVSLESAGPATSATPTAAVSGTPTRPAQVLGESVERGSTSGLAFTGLNTAELLALGLASIALGAGLVVATRRRLSTT